MSCRFVREPEFKIVEIALTFDFNIVSFEYASKPAHFLIAYWLVNHNDGIVDVTALDQVVRQQGLQLMQEAKGSAGGNLGLEITDIFESCMLRSQHRAVEINQRGDLVFNCRHGDHFHPFAFVVI